MIKDLAKKNLDETTSFKLLVEAMSIVQANNFVPEGVKVMMQTAFDPIPMAIHGARFDKETNSIIIY